MFDEITKRKKPIPEKLISYGFQKNGDFFQYFTEIHNGEFALTIQVSLDGNIDTNLFETETSEEYVLYKTAASGAYVGEIKNAVEQTLHDIVQKCYEASIFKTEQAQTAIKYVREAYGDELEFLWTKFPDNAIWRRKDNQKWYGAILTVTGKKNRT